MRIRPGLPNLRTPEAANAIATIFARAVAENRLAPVHWSIQTNHLHLVLEADSSTALSQGMQSLTIRIALALNKVWKRKGTVFARRYFARAVEKTREVRNVIRYVLLNRKRHGSRLHAVDPYSSGRWFKGWATPPPSAPPAPIPVAEARSCLLQEDYWRFFGPPIDVHEQPVGPPVFDHRRDAALD
jgi:REP element-mobilizing transposase RayT